MIYVKLSQETKAKTFAIGLSWNEVLVGLEDTQKEIAAKVQGYFEKEHKFGISSLSSNGSVYSVAPFPFVFNGIRFPKVYSLADAIAKSKRNGIFCCSFNVSDLDDELHSFLLNTVSTQNLGVDFKEGETLYWGCAFQDGVVVSNGEFFGSWNSVSEEIQDASSLLSDLSLFSCEKTKSLLEALSGGIPVETFSLEEIDSLDEIEDSKIKQIKGISKPFVLSLVAGLAVVLSVGLYIQNNIESAQKAALIAEKIKKTAQLKDKKSAEEQARQLQIKKTSYFRELTASGITNTKSIDFSDATSQVLNRVDKSVFGWGFVKADCSAELGLCNLHYQREDSYTSILDFSSMEKVSIEELTVSADGGQLIYSIPIKVNGEEPKTINEDYVKSFFSGLKLDMSPALKNFQLIDSSKRLSTIDSSFKWSITNHANYKKSFDVFPDFPAKLNVYSLKVSSSDRYLMSLFHRKYQSMDWPLKIKRLEIQNTTDNGITWAVEYHYISQ